MDYVPSEKLRTEKIESETIFITICLNKKDTKKIVPRVPSNIWLSLTLREIYGDIVRFVKLSFNCSLQRSLLLVLKLVVTCVY